MARVEEYRRLAAECLRLARRVSEPGDKDLLVQMAVHWRELAAKAQKRDEAKADE